MELGSDNQQRKKQIYDFVTSTNRNLALPGFLRQLSLNTVEVVFDELLPLSVNVGNRQKQLICALLESLFLQHSKLKKEMESQSSSSKLSVVNYLISLPTHYINFVSQPQLKQERAINISNVQLHKRILYTSVLEMAQHLDSESRLLVINRLLVLGYQKTVTHYFLSNQMSEFVLLHIPAFSKLKNLLAALYQEYITQLQPSKYHRKDLKQLLVKLANHSFDLTEAFVGLLNLDIKIHEKECYRTFFDLIHKTKLQTKIFENLLKWWAVSKTYILTEMHSRVRCNILYLLICNWDKAGLVNGDFMVSIIEGIKRKLTDGASKSQALLIWKAISLKMELPKTAQVQNSREFQIYREKQHQVQQNQSQKNVKNVKGIQEDKIDNSKILTNSETFQQEGQIYQNAQQQSQNIQKQGQQSSFSQQEQTNQPQSIIIRPKNIYDCILSLRLTNRQKMALQQLPFIIRHNNEDLILMWNSLMQQLLCPIKEQYRSILTLLLCKRPQEFIQSASCLFMNRQTNVGQKIEMILILIQGIQQLSSEQNTQEKEDQNQNFYFKKVRSRYLKQPQANLILQEKQKRIEEKSRRWGHTRIQHEKKQKEVSLNIVGSVNRINRFYPVSNLIFYKIIDIFALDIINSLRKHQIFVQHLLKLLAVFTSNIKNHFEKQVLLTDICCYCQKIVQELVHGKEAKRYEESGGQTLMLCLQVVNKVALVLDKYTNQHVMGSLKVIVEGARKLPNYGMNSILDLIQGNIYRNVYGLSESEY